MTTALPSIADVAQYLEEWAPPSSAQSYDNVGLQVGDPAAEVQMAVIALDMTPGVLQEAADLGASLIISHHPLIFRPLRHLTPKTFSSNLALRLAESRIALYSIHTNLDAAPGGVSFALGQTLGIRDLSFLAGDDDPSAGLGAIGSLDRSMKLNEFLARVSKRLDAGSVRYAGIPDVIVRRVAVCGGAGADLIELALEAEADAYVTSDIKYHEFFKVLDVQGRPRMALIDAGHYETEAMTVDLLRKALTKRFPDVEWRNTSTRTSPVRRFPTSL